MNQSQLVAYLIGGLGLDVLETQTVGELYPWTVGSGQYLFHEAEQSLLLFKFHWEQHSIHFGFSASYRRPTGERAAARIQPYMGGVTWTIEIYDAMGTLNTVWKYDPTAQFKLSVRAPTRRLINLDDGQFVNMFRLTVGEIVGQT